MRTAMTPNEFEICGGVCRIHCYNTKQELVGYALIDLADMELCKPYKWHISHYGYVIGSLKGKQFKMHRFLLGVADRKMTDHKNGIRTDNRRCNLRVCDCSENNQNVKKYRTNTTGYKGVFRVKGSKHKYMAQIMYNYKSIYLGMHDTAELAALAYNQKATELFGSFAELNIIGGE